MVARVDLTNQVFGKLTVLRRVGSDPKGKSLWECQCSCPAKNKVTVKVDNLKKKNKDGISTVSCGCSRGTTREAIKPGNVYGKLTALRPSEKVDPGNKKFYWCLCACGNTCETRTDRLKDGRSTSCGCNSGGVVTHGHSGTDRSPTYRSWLAMKDRCLNPSAVNFHKYGGKPGNPITIDPRWMDFANFLEDMGTRPDGATIDRKDSTSPYGPDFCVWSTIFEQNNNRSNNTKYIWKGKELTVPQIARMENKNTETIKSRLKRGASIEDAVNQPVTDKFKPKAS